MNDYNAQYIPCFSCEEEVFTIVCDIDCLQLEFIPNLCNNNMNMHVMGTTNAYREIITIFTICIKKYMIMSIRQSVKVYLDHKITDPRLTSKSSPSSSSRVSPEKVGALFSICFKSEESPSSLVFPSNSWRLFDGVITVGVGSSMEPQSISSSDSDMV